jgi:hypothetical protein
VSKVERLENEIRTLSTEELAAFREWFREFDADAWDREIEADALAGKLDALADRALRVHRAGKSTPL